PAGDGSPSRPRGRTCIEAVPRPVPACASWTSPNQRPVRRRSELWCQAKMDATATNEGATQFGCAAKLLSLGFALLHEVSRFRGHFTKLVDRTRRRKRPLTKSVQP